MREGEGRHVVTIESLDRYERMPGEYLVFQVENTQESVERCVELLASADVPARLGWLSYPRTSHVYIERAQWRDRIVRPGDYVTFRKRRDGKSWSVITYTKANFECRYRRINA